MSGGFTFIHAADLHLDSQFRGLEQAALSGGGADAMVLRRLRDCTFEALEAMVDLCIHRKVDFLLLAGDIYDAADKSLRAQIRFRDQLNRLADAGIPAFVVHGNHDHGAGWRADLRFPDTVHFFSDREVEARPYLKNGQEIARIYGISYPRQTVLENYAARFHRDKNVPFAIALLHCNVGGVAGHQNYAPCRLSDLLGSGFDYWALGHVHSRTVLTPAGPWAVYPGCSQGRNPRETGDKGCFLVSVLDTGSVTLEFVPVGPVRWEAIEVSIEGLSGDQELLDRLEVSLLQRREAARKPVIARVSLTGRGLLHKNLTRPAYAENLAQELRCRLSVEEENFLCLESIEVATGAEVDLEELAGSDTLLGDLLALAGQARQKGELRDELKRSLSVLLEHPRAARRLGEPTGPELDELLERAANMAVDLLLEDERSCG